MSKNSPYQLIVLNSFITKFSTTCLAIIISSFSIIKTTWAFTEDHRHVISSVSIENAPRQEYFLFSQSKIKLCNSQQQDLIRIAIAYPNGNSQGWYKIEPNNCQTIHLGRYEGEIFYYQKKQKNQAEMNKEVNYFCINTKDEFNLNAQFNCQGNNLTKVKMDSVRMKIGEVKILKFN